MVDIKKINRRDFLIGSGGAALLAFLGLKPKVNAELNPDDIEVLNGTYNVYHANIATEETENNTKIYVDAIPVQTDVPIDGKEDERRIFGGPDRGINISGDLGNLGFGSALYRNNKIEIRGNTNKDIDLSNIVSDTPSTIAVAGYDEKILSALCYANNANTSINILNTNVNKLDELVNNAVIDINDGGYTTTLIGAVPSQDKYLGMVAYKSDLLGKMSNEAYAIVVDTENFSVHAEKFTPKTGEMIASVRVLPNHQIYEKGLPTSFEVITFRPSLGMIPTPTQNQVYSQNTPVPEGKDCGYGYCWREQEHQPEEPAKNQHPSPGGQPGPGGKK